MVGHHKGAVKEGINGKGVEDDGAAAAGVAAEQEYGGLRYALLRIHQQRLRQRGHLHLHDPLIQEMRRALALQG